MTEPVRYIISCAARTGSTMLVHLLRSHPDVLAHGEVFTLTGLGPVGGKWTALRRDEPSWDRRLQEWRDRDPSSFLREVVFDAQEHRAVGFKFKTDEAFSPACRDVLDEIRLDSGIAVIRLRRHNTLDTYVSHQAVLRQGAPTLLKHSDESPRLRPFRARVDEVLSYIEDLQRRELMADEAYAGHRQLAVWYEQLDQPAVHAALATFLCVQPKLLTSPTRKGITQELLLNRAEVAAALASAGLPMSTDEK